ncbi:MAG: hypothetical protein AVDCRST_MAG66-54 [uncultured Pseudonocardia sp.]|uniref:Uncharacterized protein n=1 Tax=uncultured Pseudonocardia sp. TaxID=211455 RepID=A0A6J4N4W7_9PSEU|nr:MAG: hypothetical protein AVDCRST_MAG66-54 [uncultured Pseudonocardia sp.]
MPHRFGDHGLGRGHPESHDHRPGARAAARGRSRTSLVILRLTDRPTPPLPPTVMPRQVISSWVRHRPHPAASAPGR